VEASLASYQPDSVLSPVKDHRPRHSANRTGARSTRLMLRPPSRADKHRCQLPFTHVADRCCIDLAALPTHENDQHHRPAGYAMNGHHGRPPLRRLKIGGIIVGSCSLIIIYLNQESTSSGNRLNNSFKMFASGAILVPERGCRISDYFGSDVYFTIHNAIQNRCRTAVVADDCDRQCNL
jgi:hypothetical protein